MPCMVIMCFGVAVVQISLMYACSHSLQHTDLERQNHTPHFQSVVLVFTAWWSHRGPMVYSLYDVKFSVTMRSQGVFSQELEGSESWPPCSYKEASREERMLNEGTDSSVS